ncbi:MAG: 30S ribosomal protein S3 [Candidatus Niyogibacteria bacterium CG10_big_fil_rev_8_21_14_0_10_42_19]|uniref:Small ribosomal subunit protein uS3 n=1 Tax=Candidatus Niyogibacteria bacterium CG10_big_fil_rev_8_21_14_0_10_42_19 TaxID=1974725 RepID=A0A2H0TFA8_9BACT|nr:MAG: 30S ribosomal protein S3 [Candidatus Niyogibacteria bacterium CG10_big_fil_rev_8_21_14_0_10_42_19]
MSHNVHPYAFRLGFNRDWKSRWFGGVRQYRKNLKVDVLIREWLIKKLRGSYVSAIETERSPDMFKIIIKTSRPGIIIGRGGEGIEKLRKQVLAQMHRLKLELPRELKISIEEALSPESHAAILAMMMAEDLERRLPFRRVLKRTIEKAAANKNVKGVKIKLSGRLDGAEMGRVEWLMRGRIPLQTLRSDIDFARERAHLPYGHIGIKVWIYKGEIFEHVVSKESKT